MSPDPIPSQYVAYPRAGITDNYGTIEQLQALGDAYFGLGDAFMLAVLAYLVSFVCVLPWTFSYGAVVLFAIPVVCFVVSFLSDPHAKRLAHARNWSSGRATALTVALGLTSWFLFGFIGFSMAQGLALAELRKYGIKPGLRFNKKVFKRFVEERVRKDGELKARLAGLGPPSDDYPEVG